MKDLIILVADKNIQFALQGIMSRKESLGIKDISQNYDLFIHPNNDPGCYKQCVDFLRPYHNEYSYALVVFDHEGSGQETKSRNEIEIELERNLNISGWGERAVVVVLYPEIEAWVWSKSPYVEKILGWEGINPSLREWLHENNFLEGDELKPKRPKEAMENALKKVNKPRSSARYLQLAEKVSFRNCTDESFTKLERTLQKWFAI